MNDSLAVVHTIQQLVPWLSPEVQGYLAHLLLSLPIVGSVLALEFVGALVARVAPQVTAVTGRLARWSFILNPILAALLGHAITGNAAMGLVAGGVWGAANSGLKKLTGASLGDHLKEVHTRSAAILLLTLGLLAVSWPGTATAATPREEVPGLAYSAAPAAQVTAGRALWSPANFTLAVGAFHDWHRPCLAVQPGWRLGNRPWTIRGRIAWKAGDFARPRQREVGMWLTF